MASRISVNVHGNNVPDRKRLLDLLLILQPPAVLVLDNLDLAREIKKLLPNTTVIFREYGSQGDSDLHKRFNPRDWLDSHVQQGKDGVALHVLNEPGFTIDVLAWLAELVRYNATSHRVTLVIGNWSTGTPNPEQWPMAKDLLLLADQHRAITIIGLHEYFGGVVTSGLYGGYPDNAGVAPGKPGGINLIPPANWPTNMLDKQENPITRYHLGRFKFLLDYCDSIKLRYPRIMLTEHGADDTSDIKAWEEKLKLNAPYLNVRGWKTLRNQWADWWLPWSPERAYFEQLAWADRTIYQHSPVEAQCIFCWGHSSQDWEQFDIAGAPEFQKLLEEYARQGTAPQPQEPPVVISPTYPALPLPSATNHLATYLNLSGARYRVRALPILNAAPEIAWIEPGEAFGVVPDVEFEGDGETWIQVKVGLLWGWASKEVLAVKQEPPVTEPPDLILLTICTPQELKALVDIEKRAKARAEEAAKDAAARAEIIIKWLDRLELRLKEGALV